MTDLTILCWDTGEFPGSQYFEYLRLLPYRFIVPRCRHPRRTAVNVTCVRPEDVSTLNFDCAIYQSYQSYFHHRHLHLSTQQRAQPAIFVEHHAPTDCSWNCEHPVSDANLLLVHVNAFNDLLWEARRTATTVVEYGVPMMQGNQYEGPRLQRGFIRIPERGAFWQRDNSPVIEGFSRRVALDLLPLKRPVNPAYTFVLETGMRGPHLAVLEAMAKGVPPLSISSTALATVIENGRTGFMAPTADELAGYALMLLKTPSMAQELGEASRHVLRERHSLGDFLSRWSRVLRFVTGKGRRAEEHRPSL